MAKFGGVELTLKNVRLSYPHLFEPQENKDEESGRVSYAFKASFLIPKKLADGSPNPQVEEIKNALRECLSKTWPGGKKTIAADKRCFRDGEPIDPDTVDEAVAGSGTRKPISDGYEGMMFIVATRPVKSADAKCPIPLIGPKKTARNDKGEPIFPRLKEADDMIYAGAYVNAKVRVYGYDGQGKNPDRLNCSLEGVQFKAHGDRFGAKPIDADSAFEEEDSDSDDMFDDAPKTKAPVDDDL